MQIPTTLNVLQISKADKTWNRFRTVYNQISKAVNGQLEFGSPTAGPMNMAGQWVRITTPAVGTDITVTQTLGHEVSGVLVMAKSAPCDVFISGTANPSPATQVILQASAAGVNVTLFLV